MKKKTIVIATAGAACLVACGCALWHVVVAHPQRSAPKMVYDAHGYGGFVPAIRAMDPSKRTVTDSAVESARSAYIAGNYAQSESVARAIIENAKPAAALPIRRSVADARQVLAYSAARQHDMKQAQAQFALLEQTAAKLPNGGDQSTGPGDESPPLEQEASFQHAVCTAALGDKAAAETEYRSFIYTYPQSTLVHAALSRIEKMHGGDLPAVDEKAWKFSHQISLIASHKELVARSLCGADCVSELLRRKGETVKVLDLANRMGTNGEGTSLVAIANVLTEHGFKASGVELNQAALSEQQLPVIALLKPGHYVIVDAVSPSAVTVWDPDMNGLNQGASKVISIAEWSESWQGVALALSGVLGADSTASAKIGQRPTNGI